MQISFSRAAVLCVAIAVTACNEDGRPRLQSVPTQPSPITPIFRPVPPAPPSRDPLVQEIKLGVAIEEDVRDWDLECAFSEESKRSIGFGKAPIPCRQFLVTAPAAGTLVAELKWQESNGFSLLVRATAYRSAESATNSTKATSC